MPIQRLTLVLLIALNKCADACIVEDTREAPRAIALGFDSGTVTFHLLKGVAESIDVRVGPKSYSVSFSGCTAIEDIRFTSAELDLGEHRKEGTFAFYFHMGKEASRTLGQLPLVHIVFADGRPSWLLLSGKNNDGGSFVEPLCINKSATPGKERRPKTGSR